MHIAFEGPIAAGKTTAAKLLGQVTNADTLLEEFDENAFLNDFYRAPARWGLPAQLWFLLARHKQLERLPTTTTRPIIADYSMLKGQVFAQLILPNRELRLFNEINHLASRNLLRPNVIVYLDAPNEELLTRIRIRGREYEQQIDEAFLEKLRAAYKLILRSHSDRVVELDSRNINITTPSGLQTLKELYAILTEQEGREEPKITHLPKR